MSNSLIRVWASSVAFTVFAYAAVTAAVPSATDKAAAEALFQDGVALLQQSKAEAACAKFAASQELDRALGTMLRLADCYDRIGKTASAWALFEEAASIAQARGERPREVAARERVVDVGKRLSKIKLQLAFTPPASLTIRLNGTVIPRASWDSAIPVDPGEQLVEVSAAGFEPWSGHINAPPGPTTTELDVPELAKGSEVAPAPEPGGSPLHAEGHEPSEHPQTSRTVGLVLGGAGVLSLAVAGVTSYLATAKNHDSRDQCRKSDPNLCSQGGLDLRNQALDLAKVSTVTAIAGGALLAGGVTLLLIGPSARSQARAPGLRLSARATPDRALLGLESSW